MAHKERSEHLSATERGMHVTPGSQSEDKVFEPERGKRIAGVGTAGTGPSDVMVTGVSETGAGSAIGEVREDEEQ